MCAAGARERKCKNMGQLCIQPRAAAELLEFKLHIRARPAATAKYANGRFYHTGAAGNKCIWPTSMVFQNSGLNSE